MYAKWQVFLHTGSCLNGEKGILLSPITKVFKKIVSSLSVVWAIASCDKNCDISYVIVNTNFRVHVCQMEGVLHTGSYLNGEKCIYKSVQKIVSSLIAVWATASYNKDCEIFSYVIVNTNFLPWVMENLFWWHLHIWLKQSF